MEIGIKLILIVLGLIVYFLPAESVGPKLNQVGLYTFAVALLAYLMGH